MINSEKNSAKTSLMHYIMICFNGRFGWVPYTNIFSMKHRERKNITVLDYDNLRSKLMCLKYEQDFQFTNETLVNLKKSIMELPISFNDANRMKL